MNKASVVQQVIAHLDAELLRYAKAARVAHREATDEQSRAENKYDTRGLEASYLAHGQSRQVIETEQAREQYASMSLRDFSPAEAIGVGSLIHLESGGERLWYFLGPAAGGAEVECGGQEVLVITALSPLGRLLVGKRHGEQVRLGRDVHRVVQVR
ncbi:MAG: transcription elongation factor GreAB [Rhodospirillales bacterium]|nr:transcription elongation factor GreAB [Acetobacter sp.]